MKFFPLFILASAVVLGGCSTTPQTSGQTASAADESYVPLGSAIPRKRSATAEDKTVNLQQLQNERDMNGGMNNPAH